MPKRNRTYIPPQKIRTIDFSNLNIKSEEELKNLKYKLSKFSYFIFSRENDFRSKCLSICLNKKFSFLMNIIVIISSILLIMDTSDDPTVLLWSSIFTNIFLMFFMIEYVVKSVSFGFVLDNNSYLHDSWNILDFVCVIGGMLSWFPDLENELSLIRLLKIFRPLKTFSAIPGMKAFISIIFLSLGELFVVIIVQFFFMMIFALIGLNLWSRKFGYRCRTGIEPVNGVLAIDEDFSLLCGGAEICGDFEKCLSSRDFFNNKQYFMEVSNTRTPGDYSYENNNQDLNYGISNFRNIYNSFYVVFQVTTLEDWTIINKIIMSTDGKVVSSIYFLLLIIFNNFFMLNLTVAVLLYNFDKYESSNKNKNQEKDDDEENKYGNQLPASGNSPKKGKNSDNEGKEILVVNPLDILNQSKVNVNKNSKDAYENINNLNDNNNSIGKFKQAKIPNKSDHITNVNFNDKNNNNICINNNDNTQKLDALKINKNEDLNADISGTRRYLINCDDNNSYFGNNEENENENENENDININFFRKRTKYIDHDKNFFQKSSTVISQNSCNSVNQKINSNKKNSYPKLLGKELENTIKKYRKRYSKIKIFLIPEMEIFREKKNIWTLLNSNFCFRKFSKSNKYHKNNNFGFICYYIIYQPFVQYFIYFCIITNFLVLLIEREEQDESEIKTLEHLNLFFVTVFSIECFLMILSKGIIQFFKVWANVVDFVLIFLAILEIIMSSLSGQKQKEKNFLSTGFHILRIFRIFKLFKSYVELQVMIISIKNTIEKMGNYFILLVIFMYIYALVGCFFFKNSLRFGENNEYDPNAPANYDNFDNIINSFLMVFYLIIGDGWNNIFFDTYRSKKNNQIMVIMYFITLVSFGQVLMINIFLAYLIDNFKKNKMELFKNYDIKRFLDHIARYSFSRHRDQMIAFNRKINFKSPLLAIVNFISLNKTLNLEVKLIFEAKDFVNFKGQSISSNYFRRKKNTSDENKISYDKSEDFERMYSNQIYVKIDDMIIDENFIYNIDYWDNDILAGTLLSEIDEISLKDKNYMGLESVDKEKVILKRNNSEHFILRKKDSVVDMREFHLKEVKNAIKRNSMNYKKMNLHNFNIDIDRDNDSKKTKRNLRGIENQKLLMIPLKKFIIENESKDSFTNKNVNTKDNKDNISFDEKNDNILKKESIELINININSKKIPYNPLRNTNKSNVYDDEILFFNNNTDLIIEEEGQENYNFDNYVDEINKKYNKKDTKRKEKATNLIQKLIMNGDEIRIKKVKREKTRNNEIIEILDYPKSQKEIEEKLFEEKFKEKEKVKVNKKLSTQTAKFCFNKKNEKDNSPATKIKKATYFQNENFDFELEEELDNDNDYFKIEKIIKKTKENNLKKNSLKICSNYILKKIKRSANGTSENYSRFYCSIKKSGSEIFLYENYLEDSNLIKKFDSLFLYQSDPKYFKDNFTNLNISANSFKKITDINSSNNDFNFNLQSSKINLKKDLPKISLKSYKKKNSVVNNEKNIEEALPNENKIIQKNRNNLKNPNTNLQEIELCNMYNNSKKFVGKNKKSKSNSVKDLIKLKIPFDVFEEDTVKEELSLIKDLSFNYEKNKFSSDFNSEMNDNSKILPLNIGNFINENSFLEEEEDNFSHNKTDCDDSELNEELHLLEIFCSKKNNFLKEFIKFEINFDYFQDKDLEFYIKINEEFHKIYLLPIFKEFDCNYYDNLEYKYHDLIPGFSLGKNSKEKISNGNLKKKIQQTIIDLDNTIFTKSLDDYMSNFDKIKIKKFEKLSNEEKSVISNSLRFNDVNSVATNLKKQFYSFFFLFNLENLVERNTEFAEKIRRRIKLKKIMDRIKDSLRKMNQDYLKKMSNKYFARLIQLIKFCMNSSLFIFHKDFKFRIITAKIVLSKQFDLISMLLILLNCIVLVIDNPYNDPDKWIYLICNYSNYFFNVMFLLEAIMKIIAFGLILGQKNVIDNGYISGYLFRDRYKIEGEFNTNRRDAFVEENEFKNRDNYFRYSKKKATFKTAISIKDEEIKLKTRKITKLMHIKTFKAFVKPKYSHKENEENNLNNAENFNIDLNLEKNQRVVNLVENKNKVENKKLSLFQELIKEDYINENIESVKEEHHVTKKETENSEYIDSEEEFEKPVELDLRKYPSYLSTFANCMDFLIVILGGIDLMFGNIKAVRFLKTLRIFRSLRPLRLITKNENLKIVISCLLQSIPAIGHILILGILLILIYAMLGVSMFKSNMKYSCSEITIHSEAECILEGFIWYKNLSNFNNILQALKTLFEVITTQNWVEIMNMAHEKSGSAFSFYYFISFVVFGYLFILNIIVSILVDKFCILKDQNNKLFSLTEEEKDWIKVQKIMLKINPNLTINMENSTNFQKKVFNIVSTKTFENLSNLGVFVAILLLMSDHDGSSREFENFLEISNYFITFVFNLEMALKLFAYRKKYFVSRWNIFDFFIVNLCNFVLFLNILESFGIVENNPRFTSLPGLIRALRILRVFRVVMIFPSIRSIMDTLIYLIPSVINIGLLMMILVLVYGCVGVNLFSQVPSRDQINEYDNFKTFPHAVMMLFRLITLDNWSTVMNELLFHDCRNITEIMDEFNITDSNRRTFYTTYYERKNKKNENKNKRKAFNVNYKNRLTIPLTPFDNDTNEFNKTKKNKQKRFLQENNNNTNANSTQAEKDFEEYMLHVDSTFFCQTYDTICTMEIDDNYTNLISGKEYSCGSNFSYFYFISFIILGPIFVMNLCVVMVVEGFSESMFEDKSLISGADLDNFIAVWLDFDPNFKKVLKPYEIVLILKQIEPPIGMNYDRSFVLNPLKNYENYNMKKQIKKRFKNFLLNEEENKLLANNNNKNNHFSSIMDLINENDKDVFERIKRTNNGIKKLNKNVYRFKNYYFSNNSNNWTKNSEILRIINFFEFKLTKDLTEQGSDNDKDNLDIYKGLNINFTDCCLQLSKYLTSKKHVSTSSNLRENVIGRLTKKMWNNKFKLDDETNLRSDNRTFLADKIGMKIIEKIKDRLKNLLNNARKRIQNKKEVIEEEEF